MAQECMRCKKEFVEGEYVVMKCLASYHKFVDGMHALDVIEEKELVHEGCDEDE